MEIFDYELSGDLSILMDSEIVLYGTGNYGNIIFECLKKMEKTPLTVCNTNAALERFHGYEIQSIASIKQRHDRKGILIIIASLDHYMEMLSECKKQDFKNAKVCSIYGFFLGIKMNYEKFELSAEFCQELYTNHMVGQQQTELLTMLYVTECVMYAAEALPGSILLYQVGKIGSRSVQASTKTPCIHIHSFQIPYYFNFLKRNIFDYYIDQIKKQERVRIITGVREPISRDMSALFQGTEFRIWPSDSINDNVFWYYGVHRNKRKSDDTDKKIVFPKWKNNLKEVAIQAQKIIKDRKLDEFSWFDHEIKEIFDIDIFQYPFDKEKGYSVIVKGNIELLIYKLEKLSLLDDILKSFTGDPTYSLKRINANENKIYTYTYRKFKEDYLVLREYYEYYYGENSRMKHFYTDEEIEKYKAHWEKRIYEEI